MNLILSTQILFLTLASVECVKIVIILPTMSNSQTLFYYTIGDVLAKNGHEVTIYRPEYSPDVFKGSTKLCKELRVSAANKAKYKELIDRIQGPIFTSTSTLTFGLSDFNDFAKVFTDACEVQIKNEKVLQMFREQDLAIAHPYDFCGFGLIHAANISTHIWMSSMIIMEIMADAIGGSNAPSYVPNSIGGNSDQMNFRQRFENTLALVSMLEVEKRMFINPLNKLFQTYFGPDFPDLLTVASKSALVFANSVEFLDFTRPILHKIVYIGGIGVPEPQPLQQKWNSIMEAASDGVVLISFGSIANSSAMPDDMKHAFLQAVASLPSYTFIWKYEKDDLPAAKTIKNLHLAPWVPQNDLLSHPNLRCFVTHGGFNSFLEASQAGVPLLLMPLFFDQYGTARRAEKHGYGRLLDKTNVSAVSLTETLKEMLTNTRYAEQAKRMAAMLKKRPVKAEDLFVRWVEFVAEFKELPNLEPASKELNFFQYFLLDVFATIVLFSVAVICGSVCLCWCCCKRLLRRSLGNKEKVQ